MSIFLSELFDDTGSLEVTSPSADSPLVESFLVSNASLSLSLEFLDDLALESSSGASQPLCSCLSPESASSSVSDESSDDSGFVAPADGSLSFSEFPDVAS